MPDELRRAAVRAARRLMAFAFAAFGPAWGGPALPFDIVEAAAGLFVHTGRHEETSRANRGDIANVGFIVGERCVAVIDTGGSLTIGRALAAAVRRATDRPVCYVINTHMHPDHVFGNAAFSGGTVRFVGAASLPEALAVRAAHYEAGLAEALGDAAAGSRIVAPDLLVDDRLRLDLGGRVLVLQRWPTAHTNNDLTVLDEASGTLWLGDLLFDERIPSVDGSIKGWIAVGERLREQAVTRVIPGHGRIAPPWPAALDTQSRYLRQVVASVRAALAAGKTLRETVDAANPADANGWLLAEAYHRRNVTAAYAELEWE